MKPLVIAIDGPSGAGKGTVARAIARQLQYRHIDTGAMYRAVGWKALIDGLSLDDEAAVADLAARARIDLGEASEVWIDGQDVSRAIRTPAIDRAASAVARLPQVRAVLVARQRAMGTEGGVVMEGRDIGTVVFPDADLKVYLDASADERARRRAADAAHEAQHDGAAAVAAAIAARDRSDTTRAASPLIPAPDAVPLDTTHLPVEEVVSRVLALVEARLRPAPAPGTSVQRSS